MSKAKVKVNKSAVIRAMRADFPDMGPSEMAEQLWKRDGIKVTAATISTVLSTDKKRGGKVGKPGRPTGTKNKRRTELEPPAGTYDPEAVLDMVDKMAALRNVVKLIGSVDATFTLLKSLQKLELV